MFYLFLLKTLTTSLIAVVAEYSTILILIHTSNMHTAYGQHSDPVTKLVDHVSLLSVVDAFIGLW